MGKRVTFDTGCPGAGAPGMGISLERMHLRTLLPAPWALGVPAQEVCITRTKQFSNVGCSNPALCSQFGGLGLGLSAFVLLRNARMCLSVEAWAGPGPIFQRSPCVCLGHGAAD